MKHSTTETGDRSAKAVALAVILFVLFGMVTARPAHGQVTTGDIVGSVLDVTGAAISNATVTITDQNTGATRTGVSNAGGEFVFPLLQTGSYKIVVTSPTFKLFTETNILLTAGSRVRVNASLSVGNTAESVTVNGDTNPALQTDSSSVQSSVTEKAVQDLPLNGRNFIGLVQLAPGVNAGPPTGIPAGGAPDDRRQSSSIAGNGQSYLENNELIDGLDNNEREQGVIGVRPSIDAISEVRVITSNYPAEVGRAAGAVVNVITKAGTNNFHGSAFEFFRNDIFDGRDYFATTGRKAELRQNQFGGSIGGPIIRNKTFFFGAVEFLREVSGTSYLSTVPTLYEEQHPGDFSDIGGSVIPAGALSPVSLNYFKLYPAPNRTPQSFSGGTPNVPIGNFSYSPSKTFYSKTIDARVDHHFNDRNTIYAHYGYNPVTSNSPGEIPATNIFGTNVASGGVDSFNSVFANINGLSTILAQGISIDYLHIFSPKLVMDLKTGFTRVNIQSTPLSYGTNLGSKFGVVNSNLGTPDTSGLATILFFAGPYASLGDGFFVPILNRNNNFQFNGSLTYSSGAHSVKAGAAFIRRQLNYFQDEFSPQGGFVFFSLPSFLQGQAAFAQRGNALVGSPGYRTSEPSFFIQDDWRTTKNLTLNLGVRYDIFTPFTEAHNNYSNFNLNTLSVQIAGAGTSKTLGISTQYKNVSPRVGFALSLPQKTVLRGGFGIGFFPVDYQNVIQNANPPYSFVCFPCFSTQYPTLPSPVAPSYTNPSGTVTAKASNFGPGYNEQFNLILQKEFGSNVLTVGYVGELGRKLLYEGNADLPLPPGPNQPAPAFVYAKQLPNVTNIAHNFNGAVEEYHALQLSFDRQYRNGLSFATNYTWAKGLTDGSISGTSANAPALITGNPGYDYGATVFDIRDRFTATVNYLLPFAKAATGLKAYAFKGVQVNVLGFWQTGIPFTVLDSATQGPSGLAYINLPGITQDRPNVIAQVQRSKPSIGQWFNTNAFVPQTVGTPGNEQTNAYYGPHDRRVDLSLFKDFPIERTMVVQLRAEAFNISNTPNFSVPASTASQLVPNTGPNAAQYPQVLGGPGFGTITRTNAIEMPREFQFALKLQF